MKTLDITTVPFLSLLLPLAVLGGQCLPDCSTDPNVTEPTGTCMCTPQGNPVGCVLSDCKEGDDSRTSYLCLCTAEHQPQGCATPRCDNIDMSSPPSNPSPTKLYPSNPYPSNPYPSNSYPSNYYPSKSYSDNSYNKYEYSSYNSSYNGGNSSSGCNNTCTCVDQPPECNQTSPLPVNPPHMPCSCTPDFFLTGCTLSPCKNSDNPDKFYFCECNDNAPDAQFFCTAPRCNSTG